MSRWNKISIAKEQREKLLAENLTPEQLLDRAVELATALYPFAYVCGSLDTHCPKGMHATSKLLPMLTENDKFQVYEDEDFKEIEPIPEENLHTVNYEEEDSITLVDGTLLDDSFDVLSVHQQAPGAYVGCGSITMSDVRHASRLIFPNKKPGE